MGLVAWFPWLAVLAWQGIDRPGGIDIIGLIVVFTAIAGLMLFLAMLRALPLVARWRDPDLWLLQAVAGLALMTAVLHFVPPGHHLLLMLAGIPWLVWHGLRLGSLRSGILAVLVAAGAAAVSLFQAGDVSSLALMPLADRAAGYLVAVGGALVAVSAVDVNRSGRAVGLRRALEEANRPHVLGREELLTVFEREKARALRQKDVFSVCMMEIDELNRIHLEKGSETAEAVSRAFGKRILTRIRQLDVVGRLDEDDPPVGLFHGRQFIAILPGTPTGGAVSFANRIRHALAHLPLRMGNTRMQCSMSAGVAQYRRGEDFGNLLSRAESALRRANRLGPDRVEKETGGDAMVPPLA